MVICCIAPPISVVISYPDSRHYTIILARALKRSLNHLALGRYEKFQVPSAEIVFRY